MTDALSIGCVGDGVTDDGPAVNAWLAAQLAAGKSAAELYFAPANKFHIGTQIAISAAMSNTMRVILRGDQTSMLGTSTIVQILGPGGDTRFYHEVDGFVFTNTANNLSGAAVYIQDQVGTRVANSIAQGGFAVGFQCLNDTGYCEQTFFERCNSFSNQGGFVFQRVSGGPASMSRLTLTECNVGTMAGINGGIGLQVGAPGADSTISPYDGKFDIKIFPNGTNCTAALFNGDWPGCTGQIDAEMSGGSGNQGFVLREQFNISGSPECFIRSYLNGFATGTLINAFGGAVLPAGWTIN